MNPHSNELTNCATLIHGVKKNDHISLLEDKSYLFVF